MPEPERNVALDALVNKYVDERVRFWAAFWRAVEADIEAWGSRNDDGGGIGSLLTETAR